MSADMTNVRQGREHDATNMLQPDLRRTDRLFWIFAFSFFVVWIIVPVLLLNNYRLDVVEQFFVGQEWVFGTAKHPSLTAIALDVVSRALFHAPFVPFFLSQLFVLATIVSIWSLARDIMPRPLALAATCAMFNYWFFHFESSEYNNNVTLNAAWAVSIVLCWFALKTNAVRYWIFTGIAIGVGLHFKYTMAEFAILMVIFLICDPQGRKYWKQPGPWLTTLTAFLIFLPHMIWIIQHDYITLQYATGLVQKNGWSAHVLEPLDFLAGQLGYVVPVLIPLIPICGWLGRIDRTKFFKTFQDRYLLVVVAAPLLFQIALSAYKGLCIRGALGSHLWLFLTVYLVYSLKTDASPTKVTRSIRLSFLTQIVILVLSVVVVMAAPYIKGRGSRYHFPGKDLAQAVEQVWHEHCDRPLPWATGEWWLAGNTSVYGKDRASVYCTPGPNAFLSGSPFSTWGTLDDVRRDGCMILWHIYGPEPSQQVPPGFYEIFPEATILDPIEIRARTNAPVAPERIGMAIILPTP